MYDCFPLSSAVDPWAKELAPFPLFLAIADVANHCLLALIRGLELGSARLRTWRVPGSLGSTAQRYP
jgi:hypothetical protein